MGKKLWIAGAAVAGVMVIGGAMSSSSDTSKDSAEAAESTPTVTPSPSKTEEKASQAEQFQAFVKENGTENEKSAVKHVVKVQGAGEQNDILDAPEIHTDYTGGMTGPHNGDGKLLASAFADWKKSKNGLVTVYDAEGEILANGQF